MTTPERTALGQLIEALTKAAEAAQALAGIDESTTTKKTATKTVAKKTPATKAPKERMSKGKVSKGIRYPLVDAGTPQGVRRERQLLILQDIKDAGGTVSRSEWLEITGRYGYSSKRLGGFFGATSGVVEMLADKNAVHLTPCGQARLAEAASKL